MKYKLVIFDWDGTLMDSISKIVRAMQIMAEKVGLPVPEYEQVQQVIGLSLEPAIEIVFDFKDSARAKKLADLYKHEHRKLDMHTPLFDGVVPLLEKLKASDVKLAVATGKARFGLQNAFKATDSEHYFDTTICSDESESKPSPAMLNEILSRLGVSASDAIMVGDSCFDLQMAQAINMDAIGVSYGAHSYQQLAQIEPVAIVDKPEQLADYLL